MALWRPFYHDAHGCCFSLMKEGRRIQRTPPKKNQKTHQSNMVVGASCCSRHREPHFTDMESGTRWSQVCKSAASPALDHFQLLSIPMKKFMVLFDFIIEANNFGLNWKLRGACFDISCCKQQPSEHVFLWQAFPNHGVQYSPSFWLSLTLIQSD